MRLFWIGCWLAGSLISSTLAYAQGDWAIYEIFSRYAPSVYSVSVEIPKNVILERYEQSVDRLKMYQDGLNDLITDASKTELNYNQFETWFGQWERQLDTIKNQMLRNNRFRGAAFAINPHHLVTLSTVVKSATLGGEISIIDDYDRALKVDIKGIDSMTGIAVLKVRDATFSKYVPLESTNTMLPVASYIMTIQRPYDLPATPTSGMIGGYYRRLNLFELERYIQTDIQLYPGNEGAPVFSPSGQLIGMLATDFNIGRWPSVTFVIPSDIVADSAKEIIKNGKRERGWIPGLELKQGLGGILVKDIDPHSLAAKSGLQKNDLIIKVDGEREHQVWNFVYHILDTKPNEKVELEIQRGEKRFMLAVETQKKLH